MRVMPARALGDAEVMARFSVVMVCVHVHLSVCVPTSSARALMGYMESEPGVSRVVFREKAREILRHVLVLHSRFELGKPQELGDLLAGCVPC